MAVCKEELCGEEMCVECGEGVCVSVGKVCVSVGRCVYMKF